MFDPGCNGRRFLGFFGFVRYRTVFVEQTFPLGPDPQAPKQARLSPVLVPQMRQLGFLPKLPQTRVLPAFQAVLSDSCTLVTSILNCVISP